MVKICLAGIESYIDLVKEVGVRYVLTSYYYCREKLDPKELEDFEFVILDSGAFTFYSKKKDASLEERWDYVKRYAEWVNKYSNYFDVIIEFDFGKREEVEKFREYLKSNIEESEKIMPVVQKHFGGIEYFRQLVNEGWEYIAVPSDVREGIASKKEFSRRRIEGVMEFMYPFVKEAKKSGIKLHGLALTKWEILRRFKRDLFSVDSSSWLGGRYGEIQYVDGWKVSKIHWKEASLALVKRLADKYGLDLEKLRNGDSNELDRLGAYVWAEMQNIYDEGGKLESEVRVEGFCCAVCPVAEKCKYFDENATSCKLLEREAELLRITNELDVVGYVLKQRLKRYMRARIIEELEGGLLDKHVTQLEDGIVKMLETYMRLKYPERYGERITFETSPSDYEQILKRLEEYEREFGGTQRKTEREI